MSDRRVLATSAAVITAAILIFLIATYPTWRESITRSTPDPAASGEGKPSASQSNQPAKASEASQTSAGAAVADGQDRTAFASTAQRTAPTGSSTGNEPLASPKVGEEVVPSAGRETASNVADNPVSAETGQPMSQASSGEHGPTFDVVRVEPTGDSVVAGRAKPGDDIVLLDQGKPIARAKADASGQVAFVPPVLAPGEHSLMLSVGEPDAPGALSSQSVAISVPAQSTTAPMVALIAPDQPTRILSGQSDTAASGSAAGTPTAAAVSISAIDVEEAGSIFAAGRAAPDSRCRVYLNGSFIATVTTGRDGTWALKIKHGMRAGRYSVRVDQLQSAAGQVQARAEVPFDYPTRFAGSSSLLRTAANGALAQGSDGRGPTAMLPPQASANLGRPSSASSGDEQGTGAASAPSAQAPSSAVQVAAADLAGMPADPSKAASTVVAQLLTTKVVHGDSLWRISRKMLGHGLRYTQIYAANTAQIRDPKLIYPGQIFVMPQATQ